MGVSETLERTALAASLSPQAEIALLARALYREGWDEYNIGHITYRQPDDTLLTMPIARGWDEMREKDILRMDADGTVIEGDGKLTSAIVLHLEYHRAHPDCAVAIHQHPRYTRVWSALGRIPPAYDQRSATISEEEMVFYDDYEGGVDVLDAALAAVKAIGDANAAIMRNHGAFVIGDSIEQAFSRAVALEWRCRQAWHVEAIGGTGAVPPYAQESVTDTMRQLGGVMPYFWDWAARREIRLDPEVIEQP
jgi:ribulose-5-phosphate 4-epimerase/fuculose-1-phosphate aldolase